VNGFEIGGAVYRGVSDKARLLRRKYIFTQRS
jgi:hypothetical protein